MKEIYELEKERLSALLRLNLLSIALCFGGIFIFIFLYYFSGAMFFGALIFSAFIALFLYAIFRKIFIRNFKRDFKKVVIEKFIRNSYPNLDYFSDKFINFDEFLEAGVYTRPDIFSGNDLVSGEVLGVRVKFSDILAKKRVVTTDAKGNQIVSYQNIFYGVLFIANFNKTIASNTYAISKSSNFLNRNLGKKTAMDNAKFEANFKTFTDDEINARYILTPLLMEQILKIKNALKAPLDLAFRGEKLYVFINFNKDSFEADIKKSLLEDENLAIYKAEIDLIISLISTLNLNQQIFKRAQNDPNDP